VFHVRWDDKKNGRSGYAPACANEWVKGVCNKPTIRCGECSNQAFIPVSDEMIERHLRGSGGNIRSAGDDFIAGVYPLLPNETCWFWRSISTRKIGPPTPWRCLKPARQRESSPRSSVLDLEMTATSGPFSPSRLQLASPVSWGQPWRLRPWNAART
jgi:hypothetical protein